MEQALQTIGDVSSRRFLVRSDESTFPARTLQFGGDGEPGACQIGRCSDLFYWRYVFPNFKMGDADRYIPASVDLRSLTWVIPRPITAQMNISGASSIQESLAKSSPLLQSLLFNAAFLHDVTFEATTEVSRRRVRPRYRTNAPVPADSLSPPTGSYNADLVRFYVRATSNTDPVNQFLSFYHVLEFFFVIVSDDELYFRLRARMLTPGFRPVNRSLDGVIQDVVKHKRETDETEMLKLVIKRFVDPTELSAFILRYEEAIAERVYSSTAVLFGEKFKTNTDPQHVIGDLARRIKSVRNSLVHSSDRYERNERYVPAGG